MTTILHDWFLAEGGAERVVREVIQMYPEADVVAAYGSRCEYGGRPVTYGPANIYHPMLKALGLDRPAACLGFSRTRLQPGLDLVISDGHTATLWAMVPSGTPWIHYCHTPSRFLWRPDLLSPGTGSRIAWSALRPLMRREDRRRAKRPSTLICNSRTTAIRVMEFYRRDSLIVHPPVDTNYFQPPEEVGANGYFLVVGRLERYRRYQDVIKAANAIKMPLMVVGDGGAGRELREQFESSYVRFLGRVPDDQLRELYGGAVALVVPNEEDFCMVAIEAMACGTPVLGLNRGGVSETVEEGVAGILFSTPTASAIADAMREACRMGWDRDRIRSGALKYSRETFREKIAATVAAVRH